MSVNSNPIAANKATRKRQWLLAGGVVTALAGLAFGGLLLVDNNTTQAARVEPKGSLVSIQKPGTVQDSDAWRSQQAIQAKEMSDALKKSQGETATLNDAVQKQRTELAGLRVELDAMRRVQTQLPPAPPAPALNPQSSPANGPFNPSPTSSATIPGGPANNSNRVLLRPGFAANGNPMPPESSLAAGMKPVSLRDQELEVIEFDTKSALLGNPGDTPNAAPRQEPPRPKRPGDFIPANTFATVALLNGVDAPTGGQGQGAGGNPHPMTFHIQDLANLPSLRKLNVTDCRIMASAVGDLSSERAIARLETLTCVLPNNEAVEIPVRGHIIGEDGKYGMRGRLVSKQGQVIAAQILAEFAKGVGNGIKAAATSQTTTAFGVASSVDNSKLGQAAIGSGIAGGTNAIADYYTKLANKMFPVIEVDAGRIVQIVFSQGVQLPGNLSAIDAPLTSRQLTRKGSNHDD